jgi:hypothetical protein
VNILANGFDFSLSLDIMKKPKRYHPVRVLVRVHSDDGEGPWPKKSKATNISLRSPQRKKYDKAVQKKLLRAKP